MQDATADTVSVDAGSDTSDDVDDDLAHGSVVHGYRAMPPGGGASAVVCNVALPLLAVMCRFVLAGTAEPTTSSAACGDSGVGGVRAADDVFSGFPTQSSGTAAARASGSRPSGS
ncbi:hypothetical protein CYMTET_7256 [Cymbomonas tetramitiformis]|uniref:Uncharacterized protein n=1 Tax=Cymbomonas tetramitiformis TaxID=36881 RepID=A0AAE0LH71_9CHLO|nr:hypothetical protein CYMTET_7256 [Cymbomonas tetramitiformis]